MITHHEGQSARKPLPPSSQEAGGPPRRSSPSSPQLSANTAWAAPVTQASAAFFPMFFKRSPLFTSSGTLVTPSSTLSLFVFFLKSHTQYTHLLPRLSNFPHPWYRVPKASFVLSGVMNVLKGQTASPHILKRKITEISNGIGDISWFSLAFVIY